MKIAKLLLFVVLTNCAHLLFAQKYYRDNYQTIINSYYLYSSDDKVFYKDQKTWKPVFYEETVLSPDNIIKTNAPFTVKNNKRILFCPASKKGQTLRKLIDQGWIRYKQKEMTAVAANLAGLAFIPKDKTHYLLLGLKDCPLLDSVSVDEDLVEEAIVKLPDLINETIKRDTNYIEGYHKVLFDDKGTSRDSIFYCLNALADSAKRDDKVLIYIAGPGIPNKDGQYQFLTSDSKYDSLSYNYTNTITADTINTFVNKLAKWHVRACVFIDTNDPKALINNIGNMDSSCVYYINPKRQYGSEYSKEIVKEWERKDYFDTRYVIIDKTDKTIEDALRRSILWQK